MLYRFLILFSLFLSACVNQKEKESGPKESIIVDNKVEKITHSIGEVLNSDAKKLVEPWKEYYSVELVIGEYYDILPTDALIKASELSELTQQLKDSIRVKRFDNPDIRIRLNVLHNTALRLTDMNDISEIGNEEIVEEVNNLMSAFSSIKNKINNIVNQKKIENQLTEY